MPETLARTVALAKMKGTTTPAFVLLATLVESARQVCILTCIDAPRVVSMEIHRIILQLNNMMNGTIKSQRR